MNKIYSFIFDVGATGRTMTELSRRFRMVNRDQMEKAITQLTEENMVTVEIVSTKGRPVVRVVATGGEPEEETQPSCVTNTGYIRIPEKILRQRLLERLTERAEEGRLTNYCPACGADISGRTKQVTTYTAAVAQPANRGLGFSIDVWRVCERCAIKIMTGEHKDLIVSNSIGAVVIRNPPKDDDK